MTGKGILADAWQKDTGDQNLYKDFRPDHCGIGTTFTVDESPTGVYTASAKNPRKEASLEDIALW
jgi:hypothetical protein